MARQGSNESPQGPTLSGRCLDLMAILGWAFFGGQAMQNLLISRAALFSLVFGFALPIAAAQGAEKAPGPCEQIVEACKSAGFVKGDARQGYGLWRDCIDPIMRGTPQPPNADKRLPPVSPELIAACKQKHPDFGEHKQGQPG